MSRYNKIVGSFLLSLSFVMLVASSALAAPLGITFDNTSDLTTYFTPDSNPVFTNGSSGGINNTGAVDVPLNSYDVWTSKNSFSAGSSGDTYQYNGYFHVVANSGYGILGFSPNAVNNPTTTTSPTYMQVYGQPTQGIGISFHGGGAQLIVDDALVQAYNWYGGPNSQELLMGNWYYSQFTVTKTGSNTYTADLEIYNSDSSGTIGSLFTSQSTSGITSNSLGSASSIYPFIGAAGSRMDKIDGISLDTSSSITYLTPEVADHGSSAVASSTEQIKNPANPKRASSAFKLNWLKLRNLKKINTNVRC